MSNTVGQRQQFLASCLAGEPSRFVARVRHINAKGSEVDGRDYHFNVPGDLINLTTPTHVVVRGRGGRLVVAKMMELLPASAYPNATEWLIAPVRRPDIKRYLDAEQAFSEQSRLRKELGKKRAELRDFEKQASEILVERDRAHARIGMDVTSIGTPIAANVLKARDLTARYEEVNHRRWVLGAEVVKLEAKL